MSPDRDESNRPTARQLAYLKALAARTGQSFAWPDTWSQPSREIRRLQAVSPANDLPNELDLEAEQALGTERRRLDPAVRDCRIRFNRGLERKVMTASGSTVRRRNQQRVGERVILARYTVASQQRMVYGQRVDGVVRFQPGKRDVLVVSSRPCEDDTCRPRHTPFEPASNEHQTTCTSESSRRRVRAAN